MRAFSAWSSLTSGPHECANSAPRRHPRQGGGDGGDTAAAIAAPTRVGYSAERGRSRLGCGRAPHGLAPELLAPRGTGVTPRDVRGTGSTGSIRSGVEGEDMGRRGRLGVLVL